MRSWLSSIILFLFFVVNAHAQPVAIYESGWIKEGSVVQLDEGSSNVGIGTLYPVERLHVDGNIRANGSVIATTLQGDGSNITGLPNSGWSDLGTEVALTTPTDNVGIGTSNPAGKLHVAGGALVVEGDFSGVLLDNSMKIDGNTSRKLTFSQTNGTFDENVRLDMDTTSNTLAIDSTTALNHVVFDGMDVTAGAFIGDGSGLTNLSGSGDWTDSGVGLYVTDTSYNVAIGTFAPTQKLTVAGTVSATSFVGDGSGLTGISGGSSGIGIGTTGWMPYYAANGSNVVASSNIQLVGANVGIGTSTAGSKLTVSGAIAATGAVTGSNLSGTNTGDQTTISGNAGTATALAANGTNCSAGNYPLGVDASGTVEDCTPAGGSVGIGTANTITFWPTTTTIGSLPTATYPSLTELSYVKDVTSAIQTQLNAKDAVTTAGDFITRTANDFDVDALDEDDMTSNSAVHLATQQSIKAYVDTAISGVSGGAGGWTDGGTNVYNTATTDTVGIGTTGASGSLEIVKQGSAIPLMVSATATGNGDYLIVNSAGNVGMGTVLPSAILDVVSANYPVAEFTRTSAGTNAISGTMKIKGKSSSTVLDGYGVNFGAFIEGSGVAETQIGELAFIRDGADNSGAITFRPYSTGTGTERMRVSSGGNVGIGTSKPLALMAVGTSIPVASYTSVGSGDVYIQNDLEVDGTVYMGSCSGAGCSGASGWTDGGTAITTTTTTDTVGIGTTTIADGILQVGGDNVTIGIGGTNTTATEAGELYVKGDLEVDGTITGDGSGITNLGASAWTDGGTNVYVSPTTDNVGIGTTTPSTNFKADIRGNLYVSGNVGIGTLLPRGTLDLGPTGTVYAQTFTGPTGPTILGTSNNVGIGTITAGSLLTVGSTGQATVTSTGVATLPTPNLTGKIDINNVAVNDDDCTGEQGLLWYDSTDSAFEFCKSNSGAPERLGQPAPPAQQVVTAGSTIAADACGTFKDIGAESNVTTSTTNTFTAPSADLRGCCMNVVNTSSFTITLDNNSSFFSTGAADVALGLADSAIVCTNGTVWAQMGGSNN